MAGNHLLLSYKIIDALSSGNLTGEESWQFIKAMVDYDRSGVFPDFPRGEASSLWQMVKTEIDYNKASWAAEVKRRSDAGKNGGKTRSEAKAKAARENGKNGGAPQGNQNAAKKDTSTEKQPKQMFGLNEKTTQAEYVSEYEYVNDSSSGIQKQTTTTFINACKKIGFSLDKKKAAEILNIGIDPSWLAEPFTYPEYIARYIQDAYQNKPQHEKRKLFMALLAKEDKRDEYPEWRKTKEAEAAAREERRQREAEKQEKRRRIDHARANKPKACGHCGTALSPKNEHGTCPSCGFEFSFDEISEVYTFQEPKESLATQFSRHMKSRGKGQSAVMESVS